jgi:membrane carboxypeptidase/penicillin-binding protein PbpC
MKWDEQRDQLLAKATDLDLTALPKFPTTTRGQQILSLIRDRRKAGYAAFRKNYTGAPDARRAALDEQLKALCKPATMAIRIAPAQ